MRLPDPASSRALLLGTSEYADASLPDLPAAGRNIADLATVLTSPLGTALARAACVALPDETCLATIGARLTAAVDQAEDLLLVYYAGHGLVGPNGQLYLALPKTVSDGNLVAWTALPFTLLRETLAHARASNRLLILDCCFSGRAIDTMSGTASTVAGQIEVSGTCTLTSSPANSTAAAPRGARNTAYTGELIELLRRGVDEDVEFLTLQIVHEHLARALPAKGFPPPEQRNTNTVSRLVLAPNRRRSDHASAAALIEEIHLLDRSGRRSEAATMRLKAAHEGNVAAMNDLGLVKWRSGSLDEAQQWFQKAVDGGSAEAAINLRRLQERGAER